MAISIAILDCDLLLHGRGHKTLDRFDLDSVSDNFLLTQFGFPREFILYLVELLREVRMSWSSVLNAHIIYTLYYISLILFLCVSLCVDAPSGLEPSVLRSRCWLLWASTHQALSRRLWEILLASARRQCQDVCPMWPEPWWRKFPSSSHSTGMILNHFCYYAMQWLWTCSCSSLQTTQTRDRPVQVILLMLISSYLEK